MIHRYHARPLCARKRVALSALAAAVACCMPGARSAITASGDVSPVPPLRA